MASTDVGDRPDAAAVGTGDATQPTDGMRQGERGLFLAGLATSVFLSASVQPAVTLSGLDPSWILAMNVAHRYGLAFGPGIDFTYGPWGFLDVPLPVSRSTLGLGGLFAIASASFVFWVMFRAFRRWSSPLTSTLASLATSVCCMLAVGPSTALAFACTAHALLWIPRRRLPRRFPVDPTPVGLAVIAGLLMQVKFSEGVAVGLVVVLCGCVIAPWRRALANGLAVGLAFVLTSLLLWLAAGQSLGHIPAWLHAEFQLAVGYQEGMFLERPDYLLGYSAALFVAAITVASTVHRARCMPPTDACAFLMIVLGVLDFAFKQAFTRHDAHEVAFFAAGAAMLSALVALSALRRLALVGLVVTTLMIWPTVAQLDVAQTRARWGSELQAAVDRRFDLALVSQAQANAQASYAIPDGMRQSIGPNPVAVDPWEAALPFVYGMTWRPMPVFQSYAAYTSYLDRLNARAAEQAPSNQFVLRRLAVALDDGNPSWETPEYLLTLACTYNQVATNGTWTLLRHGSEHCAAPRTDATQHVAARQPIRVPAAGRKEMVVAHFEPSGVSPIARLGAMLFKTYHPLHVTVNGGTAYRLPSSIARGPVLMSYPKVRSGGPVPAFAYSTIAFSEPGTVTFSTIRLTS